MEGLILRLKNEPSIEKVYFNKDGGWLFVPNKHHTIIKTREEVLNEFASKEKVEEQVIGKIPEIEEQVVEKTPEVIEVAEVDQKKISTKKRK